MKIYKLLKNTPIWSVDLQENINIEQDIYVSIINTCYDSDYVFVKKLIRIHNMALSYVCNQDMSSYLSTNFSFGLNFNKLIFIKETNESNIELKISDKEKIYSEEDLMNAYEQSKNPDYGSDFSNWLANYKK